MSVSYAAFRVASVAMVTNGSLNTSRLFEVTQEVVECLRKKFKRFSNRNLIHKMIKARIIFDFILCFLLRKYYIKIKVQQKLCSFPIII